VTASELARTFAGARADKVAELLETLASLGQARPADGGRFAARAGDWHSRGMRRGSQKRHASRGLPGLRRSCKPIPLHSRALRL
jgi:hypothetical protein